MFLSGLPVALQPDPAHRAPVAGAAIQIERFERHTAAHRDLLFGGDQVKEPGTPLMFGNRLPPNHPMHLPIHFDGIPLFAQPSRLFGEVPLGFRDNIGAGCQQTLLSWHHRLAIHGKAIGEVHTDQDFAALV